MDVTTLKTAAGAICVALNVSADTLLKNDEASQNRCTVLIIGGTIVVGGTIVHILRKTRPKAFIMTTLGPFETATVVEEDELLEVAKN